ncbi:hypothetical protein PMAYCL1PPCAC_33056, partial [Pristionchus mayeri]
NSTELSGEFQSAVVWANHLIGATSFVISAVVCFLIVFDTDSRARSYRKYLFSLQFTSIATDLLMSTNSPFVMLNCRVMYTNSFVAEYIEIKNHLVIYIALWLEVAF